MERVVTCRFLPRPHPVNLGVDGCKNRLFILIRLPCPFAQNIIPVKSQQPQGISNVEFPLFLLCSHAQPINCFHFQIGIAFQQSRLPLLGKAALFPANLIGSCWVNSRCPCCGTDIGCIGQTIEKQRAPMAVEFFGFALAVFRSDFGAYLSRFGDVV